MKPLLIATRNRHKTAEIAAFLGPGWAVGDLTSLSGFAEVEETGDTFEANAALKALAASQSAGPEVLVLADDSGLEVDALGGAPGVRSARYAGEGASDEANLRLLLERLEGEPRREARFRCVIAAARAGELLASFSGTCEGEILPAPRGEGGFGYDPVFRPGGESRSFAELSAEEKNTISHRARALEKARGWLLALG